MKRSTDELLEILKSSKDYAEFFSEESGELNFGSVQQYLNTLLTEKKLKRSDVIRRSNLDKNYANQLFNGIRTNPSRNKMLMLAIGMGLNLNETRHLLKLSLLPDLYVRDPRDSVLIFCIEKKMNIIEVNEHLLDFGFGILE